MAKKKSVAKTEMSEQVEDILPLESFDLTEVYRLIHLERIPNFKLLEREYEYLEAYRKSLRAQYSNTRIADPQEEPVESE